MVVEKGFKTSDVGIIPVEWDTQKLVDLTKLFTKQTGFDYSAYIKPALVQTKSDETIPFIQNKDFNNKWINLKTDYFIPLSVAKQFPKILLDEKSLLISISGSIGNIGVYESEHLAFIGGAVAILKFKDSRIIDWVMFFLKSSEGQKKLFGNVKAGSHQNLILDDIRKVTVPLPLLSEQAAITTALSDMDELIAQTEKLIEKKKAIKQGVMQELLRPKEGWVKIKLKDILEYEQPTKYIVKSDEYSDNNTIPVLTAGKSFILGYTSEDFNLFEDLPTIIFDDFTTASQYVDFKFKVKSSAMKILKLRNKKMDLRFIFEMLQNIKYQVADHKRHWIGEFQNIELSFPNLDDMIQLGKVVSEVNQEIEMLEAKQTKLKYQKQGMMQALLTGKIRLV